MAREEVQNLKAENERIIQEAKIEKDNILREAREIRDRMINEAKDTAKVEGEKMIEAARHSIAMEKGCCYRWYEKADQFFICGYCRDYIEEKIG